MELGLRLAEKLSVNEVNRGSMLSLYADAGM